MSGVTRQSYSPEIRIIRLMCTGRVDLAFVLRALLKGADGVIIGGCWPGECHYVTEGNFDALGNMHLSKKLLQLIGLSPDRLRLEWIAASEGTRFAEVMSDFADRLRDLGPLGREEGIDETDVELRLRAVNRLVPFLKLVEREKLRVPIKSEEAYNDFFNSDEVNKLFNDLIAEKLAISQILLTLEEKPLSTREISEALGLNPSEVSKHMNSSSRQGLVRYDIDRKCYALA
jgi:coenzyme F420-reducing hydrogenase delta subunit/predicted XRE-type DNA-binding protein